MKFSPPVVLVAKSSSILWSKGSQRGQVPVLWFLTFPPPTSTSTSSFFYLSLTLCHTKAALTHKKIRLHAKQTCRWVRKALFVCARWLPSPATKRCLVSVVLKASCSSLDSAPHFLPQINRINVLKSNLVGFRVKLPGWKNNRRRLVASQGIMRLAQGLVEWLVFVLVNQIFVLILAGVLFNKCQLAAVI